MKMGIFNVLRFMIVAVFFMGLVACGGSQSKEKANDKESHAVISKSGNEKGELLYKRHCLACHQKNAGGIPGMYPPLINNKMVTGDKEPLINILLNGMSGEIEVNGVKYNGVMASYKNLSDQDLASILTYIRTNFNNSASAVMPNEVRALR